MFYQLGLLASLYGAEHKKIKLKSQVFIEKTRKFAFLSANISSTKFFWQPRISALNVAKVIHSFVMDKAASQPSNAMKAEKKLNIQIPYGKSENFRFSANNSPAQNFRRPKILRYERLRIRHTGNTTKLTVRQMVFGK